MTKKKIKHYNGLDRIILNRTDFYIKIGFKKNLSSYLPYEIAEINYEEFKKIQDVETLNIIKLIKELILTAYETLEKVEKLIKLSWIDILI